jgi:hypothetical protein
VLLSSMIVVVPLGRKRSVVIPLDLLSKWYRVLPSLSRLRFRFVVSYFPLPRRSGSSIALCFTLHLWCHDTLSLTNSTLLIANTIL